MSRKIAHAANWLWLYVGYGAAAVTLPVNIIELLARGESHVSKMTASGRIHIENTGTNLRVELTWCVASL